MSPTVHRCSHGPSTMPAASMVLCRQLSKHICHRFDALSKQHVEIGQVLRQAFLRELRPPCQVGNEKRSAGAAPDISGQVRPRLRISVTSFSICGGSSTTRAVRKIERMATGTLIKKIHRQSKLSVIHAPRVGPMAGANTTAIPYTAKACPRCFGGEVSARIACSLGASLPPPTPCITRNKMSSGRDGTSPHNAELNPKSTTQIM